MSTTKSNVTDEMRKASAELQSWRPESETEELANRFAAEGVPFCLKCADWHDSDEDHSWTDKDQV